MHGPTGYLGWKVWGERALLAALALAGCTDDGPFGPGPPDPSATRAEPEFTPRLPNAATDADGKRFDPGKP